MSLIFVQQLGVLYNEYSINRPLDNSGYFLNMENIEMY